jgi:[ribosomal protein S18]-alanine N-acetyltransferase
MSEPVVRRMVAGDLEQVARLDAMSFPRPWPPAAFARELDNPRAHCWVIEARHQGGLEYPPPASSSLDTLIIPPGQPAVVAMLVYWLVLDEAHIATLAVHPGVRRGGLGRRILLRALGEAAAEGAKVAYLEVRESNIAAQELYRWFGFEVTGRRPRYYITEDAVLMTLNPLDAGLIERPKAHTEEL